MINIQIFENEMFGAIRTVVMNDGQIWFVGNDVALALGYARPAKAIQDHVDMCDIKVLKYKAYPAGGQASGLWQGQDYSDKKLINESGLYALVFGSELPQAQEFKHWVTAEVLPQIRKTGGYIPVQEGDDEMLIMARALLIMQRTVEEQKQQLAEQHPKVRFADAVTASKNSILIRDLAKLITQNGVKIGQARLFYWLRLHGYLFQRETRPIQKWVEMGIFETNETVVGGLTKLTTKVTGKGQRYFIDGFLSGRFCADNMSFAS